MQPRTLVLAALLATFLAAPVLATGTDLLLCVAPAGGSYILDCGTGRVVPDNVVGAGATLGNGCVNVRAQVLLRPVVLGNNPCPNQNGPNLFLCEVPADNAYIIDCGTGNMVNDRFLGVGFTLGHGCQNVRGIVLGRFFVLGDAPCPR